MTTMTVPTGKQQEPEDTRECRSVAPRNTVQSNEHFEGMLDNKRFDITDEKVDWRID